MGESELPIRTEIEVLSADKPSDLKLGFVVHEYMGCPIQKAPLGLSFEEARKKSNWPDDFEPQNLFSKNDLKPGDLIICWGAIAKVGVSSNGEYLGRSLDEGTLYFLEFSTDDRECWVCGGVANLKSIMKLNLDT